MQAKQIKRKLIIAGIMAGVFSMPFITWAPQASAASGTSSGVSVGVSRSNPGAPMAAGGNVSHSEGGYVPQVPRKTDQPPLVIVDDGGLDFSVTVMPYPIEARAGKDVTITVSSLNKGILRGQIVYDDPYSKIRRRIPVTLGEAATIIPRDTLWHYKGTTTSFSIVFAMADGTTREAVIDMTIKS